MRALFYGICVFIFGILGVGAFLGLLSILWAARLVFFILVSVICAGAFIGFAVYLFIQDWKTKKPGAS